MRTGKVIVRMLELNIEKGRHTKKIEQQLCTEMTLQYAGVYEHL